MTRTIGFLLLIVGASVCTWAQSNGPAPEIDPISGGSAIALVTGALLVIRGRKK